MIARYFRNRYLLLIDTALLTTAVFGGYALRFEGMAWPTDHWHTAWVYALISVPLRVLVFFLGGLYRRLWRYASVAELEDIFVAGAIGAVLSFVTGLVGLTAVGLASTRVPLSVLVFDAVLTVGIPASSRLWLRVIMAQRARRLRFTDGTRVLIAGAGRAGQLIAREMFGTPRLGLVPLGFLDDDRTLHRLTIAELPVLGPLSQAAALIHEHRIDRVIIAMPSASGSVVRQLLRAASEAGAETRTVPALFELLSGHVAVTQLREVQIEDLLRREPVQTDLQSVSALATGKIVLVTGAGGSIGSELARQVGQLNPAMLILLGHGENSIFDIYHEMREVFPSLLVKPVIADVRDRDRIRAIVQELRPHAIFHAAAHKHVPLMEENPVEAVTNNVAGTRNVVDAAVAAGTSHFVLISTDKAVRPTSIMGATKRVAEMVTQRAAGRHQRNFVSVRFGNVLGSRGSVVPIFLRQIRAGGPVKVTHPEMRRYFMTIPEAVQLVLQAGALGKGKEVFVLDMGEPVKVVDIAADLIRLSGLEVGPDIEIVFTGIRPGEKLYEEMFFSNENASPTEHPKVLRSKLAALDFADERVDTLIAAAERGADEAILRELLTQLVPDFLPVDYERITPVENIAIPGAPAVGGTAGPGTAQGNGRGNGAGESGERATSGPGAPDGDANHPRRPSRPGTAATV